jgi:Uma2 family endonuclease
MSTISTDPGASAYPGITLFQRGDSVPVAIPSSAQTLNGFRQWALSEEFPDRGRFTFIAGELIIEMSPEYLESHNAVKTEISSVIYGLVKRRRLGVFFSDRFLLSNEAAQISTEPDAMFTFHASFLAGKCRILDSPRPGVAQELVGTPDWVLEIVSDSSMRKDKKLLRERYYLAGISEYWLVDALEGGLDFRILVPGQNGYVEIQARDEWLASPTFGCSCRLTREKNEIDFWQYTLHVQEDS